MAKHAISLLTGDVLEEDVELTLAQLCRECRLPAERVYELVDEGIVEPLGREPSRWRFRGVAVYRARCALRLERDLGVNTAGAALVLELLDEIERLRARAARLRD
jgi:chaperone modulatory protein CbpM